MALITWDESKRRSNLDKHGLDFVECEAAFDHPVVTSRDDRDAYGEDRINLLGFLSGRAVHMTYTERGDRHDFALSRQNPTKPVVNVTALLPLSYIKPGQPFHSTQNTSNKTITYTYI